ncbi:MAG: phosphoenolpyruvate--protein phosphotransferase [Bacillota bacterium]
MKCAREFRGQGASAGIAIGPAYVFHRAGRVARRTVRPGDVAAEVVRLRSALEAARRQLEAVRDRALREAGAEQAAIFEAQLLMLQDPELAGKAEQAIREEECNAEWAFERAGEEVARVLSSLPDEYLRARAADVRDVVSRVVSVLEGQAGHPLAELPGPVVVVGEELMPSDTAQMDRGRVLGFVMERGSSTAHAAILARTMGIPAVVGAAGVVGAVASGDMVVADGNTGAIVVNPAPEELRQWEARKRAWDDRRKRLESLVALPAVTKDGYRVELAANIGLPGDVEAALACGAEGVGLFRTEFLFMDRDSPPSEDEQFEVYRQVARAMAGRTVIIRTLDVGGDKPIPWLGKLEEANPFLGLRGIRLCLEREEVFLAQLRALLRARVYGEVWVMFPMVADLGEVRAARRLLARAGEDLAARGVAYQELPVGIMVEVPSAALLADFLLEEVDFVSIGTNDLTQYTLAADRTNARVASLADALHPAVLRLIAGVAEAGRRAGKWVGVCGDLAGDPVATPVLVGLGVRELSMAPSLLPEVKEVVRSVSVVEARELARRVLACRSGGEVRELLA